MLTVAFGESTISRTQVQLWYNGFKEDRISIRPQNVNLSSPYQEYGYVPKPRIDGSHMVQRYPKALCIHEQVVTFTRPKKLPLGRTKIMQDSKSGLKIAKIETSPNK